MRSRTRTFPLEIIADHQVVYLRGQAAIVDTGSPITLRAPELVTRKLNRPVRWLVGTDAIRRNRVLLDWPGRRLVVNGPHLRGDTVPLTPEAGVFQLELIGPEGPARAFLDSGAPISYAPASAVRGLTPTRRVRDFYPLFGEFEVDVFDLEVQVGARTILGAFGVLPELLASLLSLVGTSGWILGSDFFRDRIIELDFARNRLVDAPADACAETTTRPDRHSPGVSMNGSSTSAHPRPRRSPIRETRRPIEGWRGWRLATLRDGSPRLVSLSVRDVWHHPVFVSDAPPTRSDRRGNTGIHAYRTPAGLATLLLHSPVIVYGQVSLYGQVCVHENGYRGERARIDRLFLRACGLHQHALAPLATGIDMLFEPAVLDPDALSGSFCGCKSLEPDEWLAYEQLESLATDLSRRYECDVTVEMQRVRTSDHSCSARSLLHPRNQRTR